MANIEWIQADAKENHGVRGIDRLDRVDPLTDVVITGIQRLYLPLQF